MKRVEIESEGKRLVGTLFVPGDAKPGERRPAVVVTGSWTTVKEQMPDVYARRLAAAGLVALTFDFRGFGESEGEPRDEEAPVRKAQDIRNAAAFLRGREEVAPERVGGLAVCASAGYLAAAAGEDPAIRSLVLVAPWLHDAEIVRQVYGGEAGVEERLAKARAARARVAAGGAMEYVPAVSTTDASAAMYGPFEYYLDASRGAIPQWSNRFAVTGWENWLEYDAMAAAPRVRQPTLVVLSEAGAVPHGAKRFASRMPAPPAMIWMEGSQFDFYDRESTVTTAAGHAVDHFRRTL